MISGCSGSGGPEKSSERSRIFFSEKKTFKLVLCFVAMADNRELLEDLNKHNAWFHAKKTGPLFAVLLIEDREIQTLEGTEIASAGEMLCRGVGGEFWPQAVRYIISFYSFLSDSFLVI